MAFSIGRNVKICPYSEYRGKYEGCTGTVERVCGNGDSIGVRLDGLYNQSSSYGLYWFKNKSLELNEMEVLEMDKNYKVAGISFLDGSNTTTVYAYALYDEDIWIGDTVVVQTGHHGLAIAKVISIDELSNVSCGREIVCKIDFTAYNERKEKAKRRAELKQQMDEKVKELQELAIFEMLAEKDSTLKTLLTEYKTLTGGEEK